MNLSDAIGNEELFPVLKKWHYFNHAGVSPLNTRAAGVLRDWTDSWQEDASLGRDWFGLIGDVRAQAAKIVNGDPAEIALLKNTAEGISAVAFGLDWEPGDRIVITDSEYPANQYPWMEAARRFGVEVVKVPEVADDNGGNRHVPTEAVLKAIDDDRVRLVSVSHVQWSTGQRMDLATIGAACRQRDVLFGVDVIQSLGAVPVDVRAANADFLWAGCHKWQLGPMGTGLMWIRRELMDRVKPNSVGAFSVKDPMDWDAIDLTYQEDAQRYECGTPNLPGLMVLRENHTLLMEIGPDAIADHVIGLGDRLIDGLQGSGWTVVSPPAERSGILTFTHKDLDVDALVPRLRKEHHTEMAVRSGRLRFSPHFYNTPDEVDELAAVLRKPEAEG